MRVVLSILLLIPMLTHAQEWCVRELHEATPFPTEEMAIVWSLGRLMHRQPDAEYAGYILQLDDGSFIASEPITQGNRTRVRLECIVWFEGSRLAAVFHTHPADAQFSAADKRHAAELRVPSYVGTIRDGRVSRYDPATGEGRLVGTIDATDLDAMRFERAE